MTELAPTYDALTEADVRREIARRLREADWLVFQFSVARKVEKQWRDWPDLIAFKDNHALLIEAKRPGGELTPGQVDLIERLLPHLGPHVQHTVCRLPDDVDGWLKPGQGRWPKWFNPESLPSGD